MDNLKQEIAKFKNQVIEFVDSIPESSDDIQIVFSESMKYTIKTTLPYILNDVKTLEDLKRVKANVRHNIYILWIKEIKNILSKLTTLNPEYTIELIEKELFKLYELKTHSIEGYNTYNNHHKAIKRILKGAKLKIEDEMANIEKKIRIFFVNPVTFDPINPNSFYLEKYNNYLFFYSDEVKTENGRLLKTDFEKINALFFSDKTHTFEINGKRKGYQLKEIDFIEPEIIKIKQLYDELKKDTKHFSNPELKQPLEIYLQHLESKKEQLSKTGKRVKAFNCKKYKDRLPLIYKALTDYKYIETDEETFTNVFSGIDFILNSPIVWLIDYNGKGNKTALADFLKEMLPEIATDLYKKPHQDKISILFIDNYDNNMTLNRQDKKATSKLFYRFNTIVTGIKHRLDTD